jgi:hypothetical protein
MPKYSSPHLRAVKIRWDGPVTGHVRIGRHGNIAFSRGIAIFHTVPGALKRMRDLHRRASGSDRVVTLRNVRRLEPWQAKILYERAVPCALATLQVSSPLARMEMCGSIFQFARSSKALDGLESILLSAIVAANHHEPRLAQVGLDVWRELAVTANLKSRQKTLPVIDVVSGQISFVSGAHLAAIAEETVASQIASKLPGFGTDDENETDKSCVKVVTVTGTVLGALGGAALGAAAGAALGPAGAVIGGIGGFITGALTGGSGGKDIGEGAICTNTSPGSSGEHGIDWVMRGGDGSTETPPVDDGYGAGFAAGWAQSTGAAAPSAQRGGAGFDQGFADGVAAGGFTNRTTTSTDGDGNVTTTGPDGTTSITSPDGTVTTSTPDGTTSTNAPDGTVTTRTSDGTTTTTSSDRTTTTTTTSDGTTTTTTPDGTTTTQEASPDSKPNPDDYPNPEGDGTGSPVSVNAFPAGAGLDSLVVSVSVGNSHTYFVTGMPQLAIGGGLAVEGILAGLKQ